MEAALLPAKGPGAPICVRQAENRNLPPSLQDEVPLRKEHPGNFSFGKAAIQAEDFLLSYKNGIANLPKPEKNAAFYLGSLNDEQRSVFATILPLASSIKNRNSTTGFRELIEEAKAYSIKQIDKVLVE